MGHKILLNKIPVVIILLLTGLIFFDNKILNQYKENLYLRIFKGPNYTIENKSIFIHNKVIDLLNSISVDNVKLKEPYNDTKYIPTTTPLIVRQELKRLSELAVSILNTNSIFNFVVTTIGDIQLLENKATDKQYIYELFVRETKNCFNLKLRINLLTVTHKNTFSTYMKYNENADRKAFQYYPIGIPSLYQWIPDPMQVIPTGNDVLSDTSIKYPQLDNIQYLYINYIKIENSTLVLHPFEPTPTIDNLGGSSDNILETSQVTGDKSPYIEPAVIRNRWPILDTQPPFLKAWPCMPESQDWDYLGIYEPIVRPTQNCPGIRSSTKQQPLCGQFWPTLPTIPRNSGKFYPLMSPTNASGRVSSSASQPPP